jgi:hypothetical protein
MPHDRGAAIPKIHQQRDTDVLSLGFKYKVLFIEKPKTTRGKKAPL